MQALRLVAILIELITEDDDADRKRADDEIEDVAAAHA